MRVELKAVLFDLDGLLVDTEPLFYEAHRSVFAEHGVEISKEDYARTWIIRGARTQDEAARRGIAADPAAIRAEVVRRFREMAASTLTLMPHARETLERARARFRTALVTNTTRAEVELVLRRMGIEAYLEKLVTREDYAAAKPAPDGYLAAVAAVGATPSECLALEDSPRGVRAAVAAGIRCGAIVSEMTRYEPPEGAWFVLDGLGKLDLDAVAKRW